MFTFEKLILKSTNIDELFDAYDEVSHYIEVYNSTQRDFVSNKIKKLKSDIRKTIKNLCVKE